jgi:hypothetical protein
VKLSEMENKWEMREAKEKQTTGSMAGVWRELILSASEYRYFALLCGGRQGRSRDLQLCAGWLGNWGPCR